MWNRPPHEKFSLSRSPETKLAPNSASRDCSILESSGPISAPGSVRRCIRLLTRLCERPHNRAWVNGRLFVTWTRVTALSRSRLRSSGFLSYGCGFGLAMYPLAHARGSVPASGT